MVIHGKESTIHWVDQVASSATDAVPGRWDVCGVEPRADQQFQYSLLVWGAGSTNHGAVSESTCGLNCLD